MNKRLFIHLTPSEPAEKHVTCSFLTLPHLLFTNSDVNILNFIETVLR